MGSASCAVRVRTGRRARAVPHPDRRLAGASQPSRAGRRHHRPALLRRLLRQCRARRAAGARTAAQTPRRDRPERGEVARRQPRRPPARRALVRIRLKPAVPGGRRLLAPGGTIMIGNVSINNPDKFSMDYFTEWNLILRSPQDLTNLVPSHISQLPGVKIEVASESLGINLFLKVTKPYDK